MISVFAKRTNTGIEQQVWRNHTDFIKHLQCIPVPKEKHQDQYEDYRVFMCACESGVDCNYIDFLNNICVAVSFIEV